MMDLYIRIAIALVAIRKRIIVPADRYRCFSGSDRTRHSYERHKIAHLIHFVKEFEPRLHVGEASTLRERGRDDRHDRLI